MHQLEIDGLLDPPPPKETKKKTTLGTQLDVRFGAIAGAFLPLVLYTLVQPQSFGCGAVHRDVDVGDG